MPPSAVSVAIVGASGAVGKEMLRLLHSRDFPMRRLDLFASERSAGTIEGGIRIRRYDSALVRAFDLVILAVSGDFARAQAKNLLSGTNFVIDHSSAFRLEPGTPLVIPEINSETINGAHLVANPNCTTAIALMALAPLHRQFGLERVIASTYQAASGAGQAGMDELVSESRRHLATGTAQARIFRHPLPFNLIPHIDIFDEEGHAREELKFRRESQKILDAPDLAISCTAVRVPTLRAHAIALSVETNERVEANEARALLATSPGVRVLDDPGQALYPSPLTASGAETVEVGRIRRNPVFGERGLDLFVCGDQLLKGAALNAIQIAEHALASGDLRPGKTEPEAEGAHG